MKQRILIADDEVDVLNLVASTLQFAGFEVLKTLNGSAALNTARLESPDLIVLDRMMPGMSGLEVCRTLKNEPSSAPIPIILLTARSAEADRIAAFELGADDYITKPFSPRELVLRVQAILRRKALAGKTDSLVRCGAIALDHARHEVTVHGRPVELTAMEFRLVATLLGRRGRVQSREALLNIIWGLEREIEPRTVDTHLRRLREKLGAAGEQIHTVRGFGYRLDEE